MTYKSYLLERRCGTSCYQRDTHCCCLGRSFSFCLEGRLSMEDRERSQGEKKTKERSWCWYSALLCTCIHVCCCGNAKKKVMVGEKEKWRRWSKPRAAGDVPVLSVMRRKAYIAEDDRSLQLIHMCVALFEASRRALVPSFFSNVSIHQCLLNFYHLSSSPLFSRCWNKVWPN